EPLLMEFYRLCAKVIDHAGGDSEFARKSPGLLHAAGFTKLTILPEFEIPKTREQFVAAVGDIADSLTESQLARSVIDNGFATRAHLDRVCEIVLAQMNDPVAFVATPFVAVLGRKPA